MLRLRMISRMRSLQQEKVILLLRDEKVYQRLSERMQNRYDILGSLPDTIEDDWIEDIERLEEELKGFTKSERQADVFSLRYGDFLSIDDEDHG